MDQIIRRYNTYELTEVNNHRTNTIKNVKAIFGPSIFRSTYDKDTLKRLKLEKTKTSKQKNKNQGQSLKLTFIESI